MTSTPTVTLSESTFCSWPTVKVSFLSPLAPAVAGTKMTAPINRTAVNKRRIGASPGLTAVEYVTACGTNIPPGLGSETMEQSTDRFAQATADADPAATAQRTSFQNDGVVVVRGVLDDQQLAELAEAVDQNLAEPGPWANDFTPTDGTGRFFGDYVNWERIDGYRHAALHGPLPRLARTLLGEAPRFFHEHILVKERDTHEITPWHHD